MKNSAFNKYLKSEVANYDSKSSKDYKCIFKETVDKKPMIDFRFLHQSKKCMNYAMKEIKSQSRTDKETFINNFQRFVYEFSNKENISEALSAYSSHKNGMNLNAKKYKYLIEVLPDTVQGVARDELIHLHLQSGGNGKTILIGFCLNDIFFVLAVDPTHRLI